MVTVSFKGRSRRLRPKAHILDDPLGNPYDGLKVLFGPPYGPYIGPLWPYYPPPKVAIFLHQKFWWRRMMAIFLYICQLPPPKVVISGG